MSFAMLEPTQRRSGLVQLAMVGVVALVWRWSALTAIADEYFFAFRIGDAAAYDAWARRIAAGDWLGNQAFYQSPLYPYGLAGVYRVLGDTRWVVAAVQACLGSLACVLLCDSGTRWFSPRVGLIAGLALAVYAPAIFFDLQLQKSSLDLLLMCGLLWCLSRATTVMPPCRAWLTCSGLVAGLLTLNRENALLLVAVIAFWMGSISERPRRRFAGWFLLGVTLVLLPVAARNRWVGGDWLLTTAQSGPNFYIGNREGASGSYEPLVTAHGDARFEREDAVRLAEQAVGRPLSAAEVSRYWWSAAWRSIRSHPLSWARLMARKVGLICNYAEIIDTEDLATYSDHSAALRWPGAWLNFGVVLVPAVLGAMAGANRCGTVRWLTALAGVYLASVVSFYVVGRYRLPIVPPLLLLAGWGMTEGCKVMRQRTPASRWGTGLLLAALGVLCGWPLVDTSRQRSGTLLNFGAELLDRGEAEQAVPVFREALDRNPEFPEASFNLGRAYVDLGRLEDAGFYFSRALQQDPTFSEASLNFGNVALEQGQYEVAEQAYRHTLSLAPHDARAHHGLGLVAAARQDWADALQHLETAVQLDPGFEAARQTLEAVGQQARQRHTE